MKANSPPCDKRTIFAHFVWKCCLQKLEKSFPFYKVYLDSTVLQSACNLFVFQVCSVKLDISHPTDQWPGKYLQTQKCARYIQGVPLILPPIFNRIEHLGTVFGTPFTYYQGSQWQWNYILNILIHIAQNDQWFSYPYIKFPLSCIEYSFVS